MKTLIIGAIGMDATIIEELRLRFKDATIITAQEAKETQLNTKPELPLKTVEIKEFAPSLKFDEPKNFINGKKLPKKNKKL